MDHVAANEFPFVVELPKSEAKKALSFWEQVEHVTAAQQKVGPIIPQGLVAKVLRVSSQRVSELCDEGMLECVPVDGRRFVTKRSLVAFAESERKTGRPIKGLNLRESLQAAWENARGK